jgi:ABC-type uncharacterized transport system involved in gliding motility auxiliary subunit
VELIVRYSWGFALAGSVLLAGAFTGWFALGSMEGAPTWLALAGAALLVLYPLLDRQRVQTTVSSRSFVLGSGSSLMVVLAAGLSVGLYLLAERNDHTFDLTSDAQHTLSDQAAKVARELSQPVEVLAFFRNGSPGERGFRPMIELFEQQTDQLQVRFVDPLRSPGLANQHEITGDHGTVILSLGDRTRRLDWEIAEDELVEALLMLQSEVTHTVCWSMGHGEPDPDDEYDERALGAVVTELEALNYQVVRTPTANQGVPRECDALVVARPQLDWLPYEREALAAYLAEGGAAMVLLEPSLSPELAADLERYGVAVGDDLVLDVNPNNQLMGVSDPMFVVLSGRNLLSHPITESLAAAVVLPISRSVSPLRDREGLSVRALLQTSADAWAEQNPEADSVEPSPGELVGDVPVAVVSVIDDPAVLEVARSTAAPPVEEAPLPLEGAAEPGSEPVDRAPKVPQLNDDVGRAVPADLAPTPGGRLVVFGDSDFAANGFVLFGNNRDLFLNTVAWLVEEEGQLGERPEAGDTLEITTFGEAMLCLVSVIFVPGGIALLALATFLRRRSL